MPDPFTDEDRTALAVLLTEYRVRTASDNILLYPDEVDALTRALAHIDHLEKALRRLEAVGSELDDTSPAEVWAELSAALNSARAAPKGEDDE